MKDLFMHLGDFGYVLTKLGKNLLSKEETEGAELAYTEFEDGKDLLTIKGKYVILTSKHLIVYEVDKGNVIKIKNSRKLISGLTGEYNFTQEMLPKQYLMVNFKIIFKDQIDSLQLVRPVTQDNFNKYLKVFESLDKEI